MPADTEHSHDPRPAACGLYGLHLTGISSAGLPPAHGSGHDPIRIRHAPQPPQPACLDAWGAVLDLPGGRQLQVRRSERTATFTGPRLSHDELVHPYLGAAACIFSRWAGREVYHAGAFISGGRAWAILGGREAGKSSLLAALAARRLPVLADDLVVTDGHQAFCGPRTIDLRRPPSASTGPVTRARGASRWRLSLPPLPGAVPLGGWIYLHWQAEPAMSPVPASELLTRLAARRTWPGLASDPETLLALAARPGWDLGRPADWARMNEVVDLMLRTLPPVAPGSRFPGLEQPGAGALVQETADIGGRRGRREPEGADERPGEFPGRRPAGQPLPQQRP
jgi:hypothetical protein